MSEAAKTTFIVNLFGGPGIGKSTTAASLFALLKQAGISCELVTEYTKDLTWGQHIEGLNDSLDILAQQSARQRRLLGKVEFIITDSPLPLILCHLAKDQFRTEWFSSAVLGCFSQFNNINVRLKRVKPYDPMGRGQTEDQARALDDAIAQLPILWTQRLAFPAGNSRGSSLVLPGDERAASYLYNWIVEHRSRLQRAVSRAQSDILIRNSGTGYVTPAPEGNLSETGSLRPPRYGDQ